MRQAGELYNPDFLRQGIATNTATCAESYPRHLCGTDNAIGATGVAHATGVPLNPGDVVTSISFMVGGTAAGTPTAGYVALYSPAGALLAQSADFATTARAANTAYTIPLATAQTITAQGLYYVSIAFAATTVPTLRGLTTGNAAMAGAVVTGMPVLARTHGSALTATAPATIATPTTVATCVWYVLT